MEEVVNVFQGKKIFITGHTGFKGSWLTYLLDRNGAITKGFSLEPKTFPSLYNELKLSKNHQSIIGDILDYEKLCNEIISFKPDYIFHLAAQPLVLDSFESPKLTFETNFNGTLHVLETLRELKGNCSAIFVTTDKVYQNDDELISFHENNRLGGKDPYSASKSSSELLIYSYIKSYFENSKHSIASVRAGNVIGGGDWSKDRLFPDIVRSIYEGELLKIRNPNSTRPWQHVLDPILGYLMLAGKLNTFPKNFGGSWNFGPDEKNAIKVSDILKYAKISNSKINLESANNVTNKESKFLMLNIDKAKKNLNWHPKWTSKQATLRTMNWYEKFYKGVDVNSLLEKDIIDFINE